MVKEKCLTLCHLAHLVSLHWWHTQNTTLLSIMFQLPSSCFLVIHCHMLKICCKLFNSQSMIAWLVKTSKSHELNSTTHDTVRPLKTCHWKKNPIQPDPTLPYPTFKNEERGREAGRSYRSLLYSKSKMWPHIAQMQILGARRSKKTSHQKFCCCSHQSPM